MRKLTKQETEKEIKDFFKKLKGKQPKEIKMIKRLAMENNIKLGSLRKKFCKKCYSINLRVKSIRNKMKITECKNCGNITRWRLK